MALDPVAILLERLLAKGGPWPPPREVRVWSHVTLGRAFLESDRDKLRKRAAWTDQSKPYKVDPLPERMADARADFLWGEEPNIAPAHPSDEDRLKELVEGNGDLVGDFHSAERDVAGEGQKWWRIYVDRDVAEVPLLEWHSRDTVIPLFIGRRLMAVALVTVLEGAGRAGARTAIYRHLEVHVDGAVVHVLLRGSAKRLGQEVPLDEHDETAELLDGELGPNGRVAWAHGLPMLMGRIPNRRRRGSTRLEPVSDFSSVEDFLLDLNESVTIGSTNMRLTAKKRAIMPQSAAQQATPRAGIGAGIDLIDRGDGSMVPADGRSMVDLGEDVFIVDPMDAELGRDAPAPFRILEYSFDAEPLIAWRAELVEGALTRVGLTPQWVGVNARNAEGYAVSGTALRFKLVPTTNAGRRWARPWDGADGTGRILSLMAQVDALPEEDGGFGADWTSPDEPMIVERANPLPTDEVEEAQVESTLVNARVRSRRQSIKAQHPDWTDEQVDSELELIEADTPAAPVIPGLA